MLIRLPEEAAIVLDVYSCCANNFLTLAVAPILYKNNGMPIGNNRGWAFRRAVPFRSVLFCSILICYRVSSVESYSGVPAANDMFRARLLMQSKEHQRVEFDDDAEFTT